MTADDPLARLVAEQTRPAAGDEERAVHRLILAVATDPTRRLTEEELARTARHIAAAGFAPHALERARGNLVTQPRPGGGVVERGDWLPPAEIHYLRHGVAREEWPSGTSPAMYLADGVATVRDPASRFFVSRYQGTWRCGAIGPNRRQCGSRDQDWIVVDYRLVTGFWTTV